MKNYQPVSCTFFDKIEDLAERKAEVRIKYIDHAKQLNSTVGHITNIFTENKEEFLVIDYDDEIRLDRIQEINGTEGPAASNESMKIDLNS